MPAIAKLCRLAGSPQPNSGLRIPDVVFGLSLLNADLSFLPNELAKASNWTQFLSR